MVRKFALVLVLLFVTAFNSYAHDSDRIEQLENEVQELKQRLSILESMLPKKTKENEFEASNDGWKSLANWRKLSTGMSTSTVQEILGDAQRIQGGTITIWYYENRGNVEFYEGKVDRWSEPR